MPGGNSNHILTYTTLCGGIAIHNPNSDPAVPGGAYGTLGLILTSDGTDRWLLSCYHVLARKGLLLPDGVEESIYHPFSQLEPMPVATISNERVHADLDCAAARVLGAKPCVGGILGIGKLSAPIEPLVGMRVIKSGAETGVTEGWIVRIANGDVEIAPVGMPRRYELSEGGDSGAIWVDAFTNAPVAMNYRGSDRGTPERAYAKPLPAVLNALQLQVVLEN